MFAYICTTLVPGAHKGQKRALDPLYPGLLMIYTDMRVLGTKCLQGRQALLTSEHISSTKNVFWKPIQLLIIFAMI